jgi:hypothetical protein
MISFILPSTPAWGERGTDADRGQPADAQLCPPLLARRVPRTARPFMAAADPLLTFSHAEWAATTAAVFDPS